MLAIVWPSQLLFFFCSGILDVRAQPSSSLVKDPHVAAVASSCHQLSSAADSCQDRVVVSWADAGLAGLPQGHRKDYTVLTFYNANFTQTLGKCQRCHKWEDWQPAWRASLGRLKLLWFEAKN